MQPLISKFARLQRELDERAARAGRASGAPQVHLASFIGTSPAALEVKRQARRAAQSASPVLLLGETGTGKELLAHAHPCRVGARRAAVRRRQHRRRARDAAGGRVLRRRARRLHRRRPQGPRRQVQARRRRHAVPRRDRRHAAGAAGQAAARAAGGRDRAAGRQPRRPVDVRVVAATRRDLAALVREGRFRADLYYRLNVLPIRLPPLRERLADIEALVEVLSEDIARRSGCRAPRLAADALARLAAQAWPGNIRELRNVLEQARDAQRVAGSIDAAQLRSGAARGGRRRHRRRRRVAPRDAHADAPSRADGRCGRCASRWPRSNARRSPQRWPPPAATAPPRGCCACRAARCTSGSESATV